jgi:hypothetical protein
VNNDESCKVRPPRNRGRIFDGAKESGCLSAAASVHLPVVRLPVMQQGSEEISIGSTSPGDSTTSPSISAFDVKNYSALPGSSLSCRIRILQAAAGLVNASPQGLLVRFGIWTQGIKGQPNATS